MLIISGACQVESWLPIYLFLWSVKRFDVWISYQLQTSSSKLRSAQKAQAQSIRSDSFCLASKGAYAQIVDNPAGICAWDR